MIVQFFDESTNVVAEPDVAHPNGLSVAILDVTIAPNPLGSAMMYLLVPLVAADPNTEPVIVTVVAVFDAIFLAPTSVGAAPEEKI